MDCKICNGESKHLFYSNVLQRYEVSYNKCVKCGFIQTEKPYWLSEAYSDAISILDVGLVFRNNELSRILAPILHKYFSYNAKFLDYAGGYGLFVRLMRDKGFDFYWQDVFCNNLFAKGFEMLDNTKYELLTAFEVLEHMESPIEEIAKLLLYSDSLLFSTELQPKIEIKSAKDWWYFIPQTGQHISFYNLQSLKVIAQYFNLNLYSNNINLHLLTRKSFHKDPLDLELNLFMKAKRKIVEFLDGNSWERELKSLLLTDYFLLKDKVENVQSH